MSKDFTLTMTPIDEGAQTIHQDDLQFLQDSFSKEKDFTIVKTRFEQLKDKYPQAVFHIGFEWLDNELIRNHFKPLDSFKVGTSIFFAYMSTQNYVYIQMDSKGRNLNVFNEISFVNKEDIVQILTNLSLMEHSAARLLTAQKETIEAKIDAAKWKKAYFQLKDAAGIE